jgi:hypothetical protein
MNPSDDAAADPNRKTGPNTRTSSMQMSSEDAQLAREVLVAEYNVLISALNSMRSASLTRTSLFLGVLSAAGVAFSFASQGGVDPSTFLALALLVFVLVLFLGIAAFARLVEIQRELMVYIAGMNRIRYFFQEVAPASRPYFVPPIYDEDPLSTAASERG